MTKPHTKFSRLALLLTLLVSLTQWSPAAAPPQSEADLLASASHAIRGAVLARYQRTEKKENYDYAYSVLEIAVTDVAKGADIEAKDRVFVRCWRRVWTGQGRGNPGIHGQDRVPVKGDTVTVYLKGDRRSGFDVLEPNGFLKITPQKKSSGQGGGGQPTHQEAAKRDPEIRRILEAGRATGSFPKELIIRLSADLATATPLDPKERKEGEARGIDFDKRLKETWEFTSTHVHRVVIEAKDRRPVYRRVESQPFNSANLSKELLEGKIIEVEAQEGTGAGVLFAGTDYDIGDRSIEIFHRGTSVLEVGEACVGGPLAESDARAFAALYERLAKQARSLFAPKPAASKRAEQGGIGRARTTPDAKSEDESRPGPEKQVPR